MYMYTLVYNYKYTVSGYKGPYLNTIERFHIHTETIKNNHLNDPQTIHPNAIFDTLLKTDH